MINLMSAYLSLLKTYQHIHLIHIIKLIIYKNYAVVFLSIILKVLSDYFSTKMNLMDLFRKFLYKNNYLRDFLYFNCYLFDTDDFNLASSFIIDHLLNNSFTNHH